MQTIKISAYTDKDFSQQHGSALELPMEPEQISFGNSIHYRDDRQLGSTGGDIRFEKYGPATLSLKFTIDCTGVVEGTLPGDSVYDKVNDLADLLYVYNSDGHSPSYVVVTYGELLFKGRLEKMDTKYQLFSSGGVPLRATVSLVFKRFMTGKEERKKFSKQSPDMSRLVTYLCHRLYGDSLLVREVARFNELDSFRNIPAGTQLLFPPLKKN